MTREEAIRILSNRDMHGVPCGYTSGYQEALDMAIEALTPKDGDLICRAEAIEYIDRVANSGLGKKKSIDYIRKYISALPSADRPKGEWIEHKNAEIMYGFLVSNYECSKCGDWLLDKTDFCPSCGADMRGKK